MWYEYLSSSSARKSPVEDFEHSVVPVLAKPLERDPEKNVVQLTPALARDAVRGPL